MKWLALFVSMCVWGAPAIAQTPLTTSLHFAFNRVGWQKMRFVDCADGGRCRYDLDRGARVMAAGGSGAPVDEISAYFSPDRPGAAQAVMFLGKAMEVFSPDAPRTTRGDALAAMVSEAADSRRGERKLGSVRYVLRASDGHDVRVYVTIE